MLSLLARYPYQNQIVKLLTIKYFVTDWTVDKPLDVVSKDLPPSIDKDHRVLSPNPPSSFRQAVADLMLLCIRKRGKLRTRTFICSTNLLTIFIPLPPPKLEAGSDSLYSASILHPLIFFFFFLNTYHPIPFLPPPLFHQRLPLNFNSYDLINYSHLPLTSAIIALLRRLKKERHNFTIYCFKPRSLHGTWCCLCYSFVNSSV